MAHYLVHLGANDGEPSRIGENPREYLRTLRDAAHGTSGRLDASWFTDDGSAIVAIFHGTDSSDVLAFREAVGREAIGHRLTVTRLLSLQELGLAMGAESIAERPNVEMDAVDLGSDLSFPASDPPSWLWEYGNTPRKSQG